jgi:hypothetical protein
MVQTERPKKTEEKRVGRVANEVYLGAVVFGVVVMVVGLLAAVVAGVMQVSRWVALGD